MNESIPLLYFIDDKNKITSYFHTVYNHNIKLYPNSQIVELCDNHKNFYDIYDHMSYNSKLFEYYCFARFFCILEYVRANKIDKFVYIDNDVLIFDNIESNVDCLPGLCFSLQENNNTQTISAHTSVWNIESLSNFCSFLLEVYTNKNTIYRKLNQKWNLHVTNNLPGGICDMTLLYWWCKNINFTNLCKNKNKICDNNINVAHCTKEDEFNLTAFGLKSVKKINDKLFNTKNLNNKILSLHFQGYAKKYIKPFTSQWNSTLKI